MMARTMSRCLRLIIGGLWIVAGVLLNPWILSTLLGVPQWGSRSQFAIWACSAALLSWGAVTLFALQKNAVKNANILLLTLTILMVSGEFALRTWPSLLGNEFKNGLLTKYSTKDDGIYYIDPVLRTNFMIPNYRTEMQYNGYKWIHQTDALGFRNPSSRRRADVVLLGDSFIYGHGVNIEQTVGYFLESMTGYAVMNLARQGDYSVPEAYLLTQYIDRLSPSYVVYFYCQNDIRDLYINHNDEELRRLLVEPIAFKGGVDPEVALRIRNDTNDRNHRHGSLVAVLRSRLLLSRIFDWLQSRQLLESLDARSMDAEHNVNDESSLGWRFTKKAIRYMADLAKGHGAQLIVVPIAPANNEHVDMLQRFAATEHIAFVDTGTLFSSDPSLFLTGDGHFSEKGAKATAALVAERLKPCPRTKCAQVAKN